MTVRKRFKRLVRARAGATGESYTTALAHFRRIAEEANMSQPSDRYLGLEDSEYEQMDSLLDGLRPETVTEALRRVGSSSQVTACEQVRQSRYNFSYDIVLDGAPVALNVWYGALPAGAEAELALRRRLVSCGLPVQRVLVPDCGRTPDGWRQSGCGARTDRRRGGAQLLADQGLPTPT